MDDMPGLAVETPDRSDVPMPRAVDTAYRKIRRAIITGELVAGDKLQEARLAEMIGVSRTPIREALNRLSNEGLVVTERYRKSYVAHFTSKDVTEIFRLRATLEGYAAGRAASRISLEDISRLEELELKMEQTFAQMGWHQHLESFDQLNNEFHTIIVHAADTPRVERILASSLELPASIFNKYVEPVEDRTKRTHLQHREIIAALKMRNELWAEAQMSAHLLSFLVSPKDA
jgi:DNA-binding GntR family transcriptional regulator